MREIARPSGPEKQKLAARKIYDELTLHQDSAIKPCMGPKIEMGIVFFPQPGDKIYSVEISRYLPERPSPDLFAEMQQYVQERVGISEEESQYGLTHIKEGFVTDPTTIYEGDGDPKTIELEHWYIGKGLNYQKNRGKKLWERGELSAFALSAMREIEQLRRIPFKIKQKFTTYDAFKEALGDVDTNGIDHYTPVEIDGVKTPWNLFRREGSLAQLVAKAPKFTT